MAGLRGNQAYLVQGKQSAKGTPVTAWQDRVLFTGGNISPTRESDQLQETDSSRDAGDTYITQTAAGGTPEHYVRDSVIHHDLEAAFGTLGTSGTTNYTHTISMAAALPYYTLGKMQGGVLYEQYLDCVCNELNISSDAGQPLVISKDWIGRSSTRLAAEWTSGLAPPAAAQDAVYNFNDATVTLGGGATSLISSFDFTVSNSVTRQQTDDSVPYDAVPGQRVVTVGFDMIFETLDEYNKFHTGTSSGTTQANTVFTTSLNFTFAKGVNNSIAFQFDKVAYEEFPVEPDAGGDPIVVPVRARAQRHANGFCVATVKNQKAT